MSIHHHSGITSVIDEHNFYHFHALSNLKASFLSYNFRIELFEDSLYWMAYKQDLPSQVKRNIYIMS